MKESSSYSKNAQVIVLAAILVCIALKEGYNSTNPSFTPARPAYPTPTPSLPPVPALTPAPTPLPTRTTGNPTVMVWVNTNSGVYHCPDTVWYGKTKSGAYMTQEEAQFRGFRPAHGAKCG